MTDIKISKFKNKSFAYLRNTEFLVQISNVHSSGVFSTKFRSIGNMDKAIEHYINMKPIAKHKKRITMLGDLGETVIDMEKF